MLGESHPPPRPTAREEVHFQADIPDDDLPRFEGECSAENEPSIIMSSCIMVSLPARLQSFTGKGGRGKRHGISNCTGGYIIGRILDLDRVAESTFHFVQGSEASCRRKRTGKKDRREDEVMQQRQPTAAFAYASSVPTLGES